MYSLPTVLIKPYFLTSPSVPSFFRSSYLYTSAQIKKFSKSVCIVPAAYGAFVNFLIVQHLTSSGPAVKK